LEEVAIAMPAATGMAAEVESAESASAGEDHDGGGATLGERARTVADAAGSVASSVADAAESVASTVVDAVAGAGRAAAGAGRVAAGAAETVASAVAGTITDAGKAAVAVARPAARRVRPVVGLAVRPWGRRRPRTRPLRLKERARVPLPNLWKVHPEAERATRRELGLLTVPVDQIAGSAVAGPDQRGGDFLPLPAFRSKNWEARWQRINTAIRNLVLLPPVELLKYADQYWVVDGHNRVAAALYNKQYDVDAAVTQLRSSGGTADDRGAIGSVASVMAESAELRAAGSGRLSSTAVFHRDGFDSPSTTVPHRHDPDAPEGTGAEPER
jgi:hypothetical protein